MQNRYIPELDGLRAIAALAVVAFHSKLPGLGGGFLGVDVFFVLSGFLTASIALSGKYDFSTFMLRRFWRLWPLLFFVGTIVIITLVLLGEDIGLEELFGVLFLSNILGALFGLQGVLGHTWTLASEMQFYAVVAILSIAFPKVKFRLVCLALFLATTLVRFNYAQLGEWNLGYCSPFSHTSGLFAGAVIATLPLDRIRFSPALFTVSFLSVLVAFSQARIPTVGALVLWIPIAEIASVGLIVSVANGASPVSSFLRVPFMRWLGQLSFGIYLWHFPIAKAMLFTFEPVTAFILTTLLSVLLAAISYHFVEKPMRIFGVNRLASQKITSANLSI